MNNGDMPAAPIIGDGSKFSDFLDGIKGGRNYGLTKREYFAAMAMQGYLSGPVNHYLNQGNMRSDGEKIVAEWAVSYADALLKELENESN